MIKSLLTFACIKILVVIEGIVKEDIRKLNSIRVKRYLFYALLSDLDDVHVPDTSFSNWANNI